MIKKEHETTDKGNSNLLLIEKGSKVQPKKKKKTGK